MRIAITGGTGFVGGRLAERLRAGGHEPVILSRRTGASLTGDPAALAAALRGCDAVVHCAGINREIGDQTYAGGPRPGAPGPSSTPLAPPTSRGS